MLRSLRLQLPALFLLGIVVSGLVSASIALRLFQSYAQNRSREQRQLYVRRAGFQRLSAKNLELATGDRIFYDGLSLFPGQAPAFTPLPKGVVNPKKLQP